MGPPHSGRPRTASAVWRLAGRLPSRLLQISTKGISAQHLAPAEHSKAAESKAPTGMPSLLPISASHPLQRPWLSQQAYGLRPCRSHAQLASQESKGAGLGGGRGDTTEKIVLTTANVRMHCAASLQAPAAAPRLGSLKILCGEPLPAARAHACRSAGDSH
jgi:hypothetical protein